MTHIRGLSVLRRACAALVVLIASACATTGPEPVTGAHRILFVGNSLTYANDMPAMVKTIAQIDSQSVGVASVALPNVGLIDHAQLGSTLSRIAEGKWDFVVLQQGPTPPGVCRDTLIMATVALDARIRAAGGRTASLMTWPYDGYPNAYAWVHESVRIASDSVRGLFLPAGDAWVAAKQLDASLQLYGPDGYHPSTLGSLLTAFVVYQGTRQRDMQVVSSSALSRAFNIPEATINKLRAAASSVFQLQSPGSRAGQTAASSRAQDTC